MSTYAQKTTTTYKRIYQRNGTKLVLTILTCISYLFQQLRCYLCKLDFNSKAFKTYILNFLSLETLVQSKSCFDLYMLGLVQYYLEIHRFRRSVNIEHSITKWYSSSIVLHVIHFLSSRGIQCGRCHLPVSIKML